MEIIERLQGISLFHHFRENVDYLEKIAKLIKIERFHENEKIILENDIGSKLYILNQGAVRIVKLTGSGDVFPVANLSDSDNVIFGELALLDRDMRSATVIALSDVECYTIERDDFKNFCTEHPEIGLYIIHRIACLLSERLRKVNQDKMSLIEALINDDLSDF